MSVVPPSPRPRCPQCLRPFATCVCPHRVAVDNATEVLILQHPLEVHQAKGTGRLLHLSLAHSRIEVGEAFDPAQLQAWLGPSAVLLYPPAAGVPTADSKAAGPQRLVVIDATWRKSRLMLHLNPLLQTLPRLSWHEPPPSRYTVRKAQQPHQRSTLEAAVWALDRLDGPDEAHAVLLKAFDAQVATWQSQREGRAPGR